MTRESFSETFFICFIYSYFITFSFFFPWKVSIATVRWLNTFDFYKPSSKSFDLLCYVELSVFSIYRIHASCRRCKPVIHKVGGTASPLGRLKVSCQKEAVSHLNKNIHKTQDTQLDSLNSVSHLYNNYHGK